MDHQSMNKIEAGPIPGANEAVQKMDAPSKTEMKLDNTERIPLQFRTIYGKQYVSSIPFKPGMLIKRCGKVYQVDAKGTQRQVKMP
jgi:hypothetical protein